MKEDRLYFDNTSMHIYGDECSYNESLIFEIDENEESFNVRSGANKSIASPFESIQIEEVEPIHGISDEVEITLKAFDTGYSAIYVYTEKYQDGIANGISYIIHIYNNYWFHKGEYKLNISHENYMRVLRYAESIKLKEAGDASMLEEYIFSENPIVMKAIDKTLTKGNYVFERG